MIKDIFHLMILNLCAFLNYTLKTQFESYWDRYTEMCRGLIYDTSTNIIEALPFPKIFNLNEVEKSKESNLPKEEFEILEKVDGSLGILYKNPLKASEPRIATRGSFISNQALWATEFLHKKELDIKDFYPGKTYLFEIIYPENRIIIDYKGLEALYLLAIKDSDTGEEFSRREVENEANRLGFKIVKKYDYSLKRIQTLIKNDKKLEIEGFVIHFLKSNFRVKIKFEEYYRIFRIIKGLNTRLVWEYLKEGKDIQELIYSIPDEFMQWVVDTANNFKEQFDKIENHAKLIYKNLDCIKHLSSDRIDRKTFALEVQKIDYKAMIPILFNMLDKKSYDDKIWKIVRPKQALTIFEKI